MKSSALRVLVRLTPPMMRIHHGHPLSRWGFTLIELLVVVLIIGILAAIAVPQYFKVVEKGRFAEALSVFSNTRSAQERYNLKITSYATNLSMLDLGTVVLKHFSGATMATAAGAWTLSLNRSGGPSTYDIAYAGPAGVFTCSGSGVALCNDAKP